MLAKNTHDKYRKNRKNNKFNKILDLEKEETKKGPEMSATRHLDEKRIIRINKETNIQILLLLLLLLLSLMIPGAPLLGFG